MMESVTVNVVRLQDEKNIFQAKRFLYEQYITNMGWELPKNSPTGWFVEEIDGQKLLDDCYAGSSIWYAGLNNKNVINCCIRLIVRIKSSNLDIENYNFTNGLKKFINKNSNCVELTRFAYEIKDFFSYYYCSLLKSIFRDAVSEKWTIILTDGLGNKELYRHLEIPKIQGASFRYSNTDKEEISTYGFTYREVTKLITNCKKEIERIEMIF
jgi:hypothetical protein